MLKLGLLTDDRSHNVCIESGTSRLPVGVCTRALTCICVCAAATPTAPSGTPNVRHSAKLMAAELSIANTA